MKKITAEEFEKIPLRGKGTASIVYNQIFNLRKDEFLEVEPKDWKRKDTPGRICRYIEKKFPNIKYDVFTKLDKGWIVKRKQ